MHLTNLAVLAMLSLLLQKTEVGFGRSEIHGAGYAPNQVHGFFYVYLVMVGVWGSLRACWFRDPVDQPDTSTTQCLVALGGGNLITITEAIMPDSNVAHLRPANNQTPFSVPEADKVRPLEEIVVNLPELIETALSYIISDFDYENNITSNTAVAVRLLAVIADRINSALESEK